MNSVFDENILAEKLSKLNSTQQCIETLSHWCIFHRCKAEQVVQTWDKQFHSAEMTQKVPLLYLANDILQNSKRNGNEFVTEYWKVLPTAVKELYEKGDDRGKNVVSRLVDIWEERRVFGSHAQRIKNVMIGEDEPGPLKFGRKHARSVKILKRDSRSIRTKLAIGGASEKIVSAYNQVIRDHSGEAEEMSKCKSAVHRVRKMEQDVKLALQKAKDPQRKTLAKELENEENLLKQSIEKLKVTEAIRVVLVSQLQEALHEQESELENVRTQMQVAEAQADEAANMRKRLDDENYVTDPKSSSINSVEVETNSSAGQKSKKTAAAIAAEVADKLTASSSSQYIMSSVLSTFAAEEAKKAGLTKSSVKTKSPFLPTDPANNSVAKQEKPLPEPKVFMPPQQINPPPANQMPQSQAHVTNFQSPYQFLPILASQQILQSAGGMASSYPYGSFPPFPLGLSPAASASYMFSPVMPLNQQQPNTLQPSAANQQQSLPLPQPPPAPGLQPLGCIQTPGMVYYSHPHHPQ